MSQSVRITYYGMEGQGKNLTDAKKDAGAKIESFVKEAGRPIFGMIHGYWCTMWRDLYGWTYSIAFSEKDQTFGYQWGTSSYATKNECEQRMRYHLAQMCYTNDDFDSWLDILTSPQDRQELRNYKHWQDDYTRLKTEGYSDQDAHRLATMR